MCQITLNPGLSMESLPKTRVIKVVYLEEALMKLDLLQADWIQAAEDTDQDLTAVKINLQALFCDIRRLIEEL